MDIDNFVLNYIKGTGEYKLKPDEEKTLKFEGVEKFVLNKLNSTKFRAQSTSKDYLDKVIEKIHLSVSHRIPIHVVLPFGATKNPYLVTAPGIDWGEVFNIAYIREYLAPIANAYKYGVILEYISVGIFEEKVNGISQKDISKYDKEFTDLIKIYQKYMPNNFKLKYTRVSDNFNKKEIERLIDLKKNELRKVWNMQDKDVIERKMFRARRNCLHDRFSKNIESLLLESALGHDAFCSETWTSKVAPWDQKDMITLGHNYTGGWAIHVRSTPGSSVNFWSGIGVLEKRGERYIPTVLSPNQFNEVKNKVKSLKTNILLKHYSNLSQIPMLSKS